MTTIYSQRKLWEYIFMANTIEKYGFVYLWLDRKHGKYYIGCRWGRVDDGYICSSVWMKQAYRIRPQDFKRRILKTNIPTRQQTYIEEQRWLSMIKPKEVKSKYYNLNITNNEVWHKYDDNIKTVGQKISAAKKGKSTGPCSPEKAKKISEAKKAAFASGKTKITDEWRRKSGEARKGKDTWMKGRKHTKEAKEKNRQAQLGKKHTEEHKRKISEGMMGRQYSQETKDKLAMSNSKTFKIMYKTGAHEIVHGLKQYGKDRNIPYATLCKAKDDYTPIHKYGIHSITRL